MLQLALTLVAPARPRTATAVRRRVCVPSPSCPLPLIPQHLTVASESSAQVWLPPALIAVAFGRASARAAPAPSTTSIAIVDTSWAYLSIPRPSSEGALTADAILVPQSIPVNAPDRRATQVAGSTEGSGKRRPAWRRACRRLRDVR